LVSEYGRALFDCPGEGPLCSSPCESSNLPLRCRSHPVRLVTLMTYAKGNNDFGSASLAADEYSFLSEGVKNKGCEGLRLCYVCHPFQRSRQSVCRFLGRMKRPFIVFVRVSESGHNNRKK